MSSVSLNKIFPSFLQLVCTKLHGSLSLQLVDLHFFLLFSFLFGGGGGGEGIIDSDLEK